MKSNEIPWGLAVSLTMLPETMQKFSALTEEQKSKTIERTHSVKSRDAMHSYVNGPVTKK